MSEDTWVMGARSGVGRAWDLVKLAIWNLKKAALGPLRSPRNGAFWFALS